MKKWLLSLCVALLLASPCLGETPRLRPDSWATPILSENLQNGYRVDSLVYRSAQPDAAAMEELKVFGIQRVLNLREFHDDEEEVGRTGLRTFRIPINAAAIHDDQMVEALRIITSSEEPILVHCWHGSDRTGVVVAMYRMVVQGWPRESAIDELVHGGYGYHSIYGNIVDYLEKVDVAAIGKALEASRLQSATEAAQSRQNAGD